MDMRQEICLKIIFYILLLECEMKRKFKFCYSLLKINFETISEVQLDYIYITTRSYTCLFLATEAVILYSSGRQDFLTNIYHKNRHTYWRIWWHKIFFEMYNIFLVQYTKQTSRGASNKSETY